jgi:anti-sigma B factor antagonist
MTINFHDISENLRRISIFGRLDTSGTETIAAQFTELTAAAKRSVLVDLTAVKFLGSIGIRSLVVGAKDIQQRGGKMVLLTGDNSAVARTLEATGIDALIPMFENEAEARSAALA